MRKRRAADTLELAAGKKEENKEIIISQSCYILFVSIIFGIMLIPCVFLNSINIITEITSSFNQSYVQ